jgi:hypothetical protein
MMPKEGHGFVRRVHKTHKCSEFAVPGARADKAAGRQRGRECAVLIRTGQYVVHSGRQAERSARLLVDSLCVVLLREMLGGQKAEREASLWDQHSVGNQELMLVPIVVDDRPFDGAGPLALLIAANALDLCRASFQGANEISLVVGQALGRAVVDANREGIGVEKHEPVPGCCRLVAQVAKYSGSDLGVW